LLIEISRVLASWDAEEYGLIGSTEFFEQYTSWALANIVAYINLDIAVCGPRFVVDAVPELHDIITTTLKKVSSPTGNGSLYDAWEAKDSIGVLGSGSDYTSFVTNGIASLDFGFSNGPMDPVYHYHSNYDSYHWMATFGDPEFKYHVAAGQFLGLLAMELADANVIPMNTSAYTEALRFYFDDLKKVVSSSKGELDLGPIDHAIKVFGKAAKNFDAVARNVGEHDVTLRKTVNYKLKTFERAFAHQGGLPGREFYKHGEPFCAFDVQGREVILMNCSFLSGLRARIGYWLCPSYVPRSHGGGQGEEFYIGERVGVENCERDPGGRGGVDDLAHVHSS
jgi:N-acetylated-alpha-linked acidic dipeptidase